VIQRAPVYWLPSSRMSASYSPFKAVLHHFKLQLAHRPSSMLPPISGRNT
jgi:hypothetical protein